jgi:hypothetical protein
MHNFERTGLVRFLNVLFKREEEEECIASQFYRRGTLLMKTHGSA